MSRSVFQSRVRQLSTAAWKAKRDNDRFADMAIRDQLRSRAAYKLEEMDTRFGRFLRQGAFVVDLGAAPGGFSLIAARAIRLDTALDRWHQNAGRHTSRGPRHTMGGSQPRRKFGKLICVDIQEMDRIPGATFVRGDMNDEKTRQEIMFSLNGVEADVVLSDMAPDTTSDKGLNHVRIMGLAEEALETALTLLRNGGTFCCKVFSGAEEQEFRDRLRAKFAHVKAFKPAASRKESVEVYYVATGFVPEHHQNHEVAGISFEDVERDFSLRSSRKRS